MTRKDWRQLAISAVFFGLLSFLVIFNTLTDYDSRPRNPVVSAIVVALLMFILVAFGIYPILKRRRWALATDANGIWWVDGSGATLFTWRDVAGVGCTIARLPWWMRFSNQPPRQNFHIEVYLRASAQPSHRHLFERWGVDDDAPQPGMPRERLRFSKLDRGSTDKVVNAVRGLEPQRWLGN